MTSIKDYQKVLNGKRKERYINKISNVNGLIPFKTPKNDTLISLRCTSVEAKARRLKDPLHSAIFSATWLATISETNAERIAQCNRCVSLSCFCFTK